MASFDVVSRVDMQEVDNAVNQARKEVNNRYDLKNSKNSIDFDEEKGITIIAADEMKRQAVVEILNQKMAKRGVSMKSLDYKEPESASGGALRQLVEIKQGISTEEAKKIVKLVKDKKLKKIQAQIQQDQVRIIGPKKDDLQEVISLLKADVPLDLQFVNFKD